MNTLAISIILIHGGFVDGSGWEPVYNILKKDGYSVSIAQHPTVSLADGRSLTAQQDAQSSTCGGGPSAMSSRGM